MSKNKKTYFSEDFFPPFFIVLLHIIAIVFFQRRISAALLGVHGWEEMAQNAHDN